MAPGSQLASLPLAWNYAPQAFASAVLADGRVLIEGGEYNAQDGPFPLTNKGAIYDPVVDAWAQVAPPPGWGFIGDSPSSVMPNGKFLLGGKLDMRVAELDPATMTWTELGATGKADFNAEEGWTLLPDGSILTVDVLDTPNTERYLYTDAPGAGQWVSLGPTPESLTWNYGPRADRVSGRHLRSTGRDRPVHAAAGPHRFLHGRIGRQRGPYRTHGHLRCRFERVDRRPRLSRRRRHGGRERCAAAERQCADLRRHRHSV